MSKRNRKLPDPKKMKVQPVMCGTCPFREGSKTAYLRTDLSMSALTNCSRICHCTGKDNAFHKNTGKPEALCRGARDLQLKMFHSLGVLSEPTDEAWAAKLKELKLV